MRRLAKHDGLNFLLTNRIPRATLTRWMGHLSRVEQPLVRRLLIGAWTLMTDLDLSDAADTQFRSLHECFVRRLRPGARPIDPRPDVAVSPCDGIVVGCGPIQGTTLIQAKGHRYTLEDLLGDPSQAAPFRDGCYVTIRLPSSVYHHFHAPGDAVIERVTYFAGDTWNTNPAALHRVEKLYCRNERAALCLRMADGSMLGVVPVAAILVASLRLTFMDLHLHLDYRGPRDIACAAPVRKGEELGWFEHGSTIIVLAPRGFAIRRDIGIDTRIRMGEALLCHS
jgi:phosphatidylserine decarboxylase